MELKVFRDVLPAAGADCTAKAELPLETELLISDYLPPVQRIVKCFAKPVVLQKQLAPGRLTLEGYLRCTVYYQGEEGAGLCQTEQKLPFTKALELPSFAATAMLRLSGWRPYQLQCVADAFSTRFETTLTPQTLATESLHCALDETTVLRGSGPLPDAGAHILACFASFGPVSLTRQEGRAVLTARAVVSAFAENTLGEMECYEKALDYALPLPADLPPDTDAYPECWLSVQDLQCASAGGALDVSLTVRAEGAVLARQTASLVGAVELGDPLAPADPEVSLRICYAQPGEELFAIARRYHVSPGQMLAANDLPDGTARLDEARRLLVPGG